MGRIYIEGAGFAFESATERTPDKGRYYIFKGESIDGDFDSRDEALEEYRKLCRAYWAGKMDSSEDSDRLMGARGLLTLDKSNLVAWTELAQHGNPSEKTKAAFWIRKLSGEAS